MIITEKRAIMQVFELYFNSKAEQDIICDSFCYEPESDYEKRLGNLYIIGQISNTIGQNPRFLDNLARTIKEKYYSRPSQSPASALGSALKQANKFLARLVKKGDVAWLGNLDLAIFVLKESQAKTKTNFTFNFTTVGKPKLFLRRENQILEIGKELELQEIEPYPPKIFFNIASGRLKENDRVFVFTPSLLKQSQGFAEKISFLKNFDEKNIKTLFKQNEQELQELSAICFTMALNKEVSSMQAITLDNESQDFSFSEALSPVSGIVKKIISPFNRIAFIKQGLSSLKKLKILKREKIIPQASPEIPEAEISNSKILLLSRRAAIDKLKINKLYYNVKSKVENLLAKLKLKPSSQSPRNSVPWEKSPFPFPRNRVPWIKGQIKKTLILTACLALILVIGFFIFNLERTKSIKAAKESLAGVEEKIFQAQSFMILDKKNKANLLFQQAWQDVLPQAEAGKELKKQASEMKSSIEQNLALLNKLENIEAPEILFEYNVEAEIGKGLANQAIFKLSEQSFALYFLNAKSGWIIKYPYNVNYGWGAPEQWLKQESPTAFSQAREKIMGAKSIAVDGSIWILARDNLIHRFHLGLFEETITINIFPFVESPTKLFTTPEHSELYVLEPINNRIIILSKQGKIIKQITSEKFNNLLDFTVSSDGKTIFLLNNRTVYKIEI